jgi:hypothetical protein
MPSLLLEFLLKIFVFLISLSLYMTCHFSFAALNSLLLLCMFNVLPIICLLSLRVFLFWSFLSDVLKVSSTWMDPLFSRLEKFSAIILLIIFYKPLVLSPLLLYLWFIGLVSWWCPRGLACSTNIFLVFSLCLIDLIPLF